MSLRDKLKSIPKHPGVYFFKDKKSNIIYIGKAKNLKIRVSSYFNKTNQDTKSKIMVSHARDIEYLVVVDEVQAIITEANMIKEYKPRYNIALKDDKTFPYIIITNEPYPRVEIIRKKNLHRDGNTYFGPYTDVNYLREVVKVLHRIFPIRTCSYSIDSQSIKNKKVSICLDYHIKKCQGPCEGLVSEYEYQSMIESVIQFLKGKNKTIREKIKSMMDRASQDFNYEEAARLRDQLIALDSFYKKQKKIAHDFNNILTVILGNLSLANVKLPKGVEGDEEIGKALSATLRAQNRVQQLLTFAKGGSPIRQTIDFGKVISEILEEHDRDDQIQYMVENSEDIWKVDADPGQFRRVVENLLRNAEQAMPGGGKIVISLMNAGADGFLKRNLPSSLGLDEGLDYVILQIIDDGHGIDDELLEKVFEPYFTSRTQANATGIGLTVCESITRAHNGGIALEPNLPSGTRVVVAFPASTDQESTFEKIPLTDKSKSSPSILILEDDSLIRQLLVANLEREGYEVTETEDGVDTVARYIERYRSGNPYDLVIMDLSVPKGMGGARAIKEILNIDFEVKAIVSSGYSDDPAMADPKSFGFSGVLPKPYQPNELIALVRGILK